MAEQKELDKGYVVVDTTIGEIIKKVNEKKSPNQHGYYDIVPLYEHEIDRSNLTEEDKAVQLENRWYVERKSEIRLYEDLLYTLVSDSAYEELANGIKENLADNIYKQVIDTKVRSIARLEKRDDDTTYVNVFDEIGEQITHQYIESTDIKEFEKELEGVKSNGSYVTGKPKYVWLEKFMVGAYPYMVERIEKNLGKLVNRFIRKELTYCMKNGTIIVPDEYLQKGKEGIAEWQELKRSNNKSNSMEKRMLKQVFRDRREFAYKVMAKIVDQISSSHTWTLPSLTVDGRWNVTKMNKLITQIADTKDKQKFLDMTNEELVKLFKEYWKDVLTKACEEIDKLEIEEK